MMARILGSVAEQETATRGSDGARANLQRAQEGGWRKDQPRVTFGYTPDGERLEPEATAVTQAITDVLAGGSIRSIAGRVE